MLNRDICENCLIERYPEIMPSQSFYIDWDRGFVYCGLKYIDIYVGKLHTDVNNVVPSHCLKYMEQVILGQNQC